ncbi:MAG: flagellar hook-basal body complex protein FliE [Gammaproteobacteria bacterium]|nr:flagellar hook-basal body complex protein FliE [Gammaproteobacteria bacterium]
MNSVDMTQLLNRLRATAAVAEGRAPEVVPGGERVDFAAMLKQSLDAVNDIQQSSNDMATRIDSGDAQVSLEEVMMAKQKASISFEAMVQVRNKLVSAYQEVMAMQI